MHSRPRTRNTFTDKLVQLGMEIFQNNRNFYINEGTLLNLDLNESFTSTDLNRIKLVSSIQNLSTLSVNISIFQSLITTLS